MAKTNVIIPENESKNEKFIRIASPRVNSVIDKLDILSNCASANYEYTEDDVEHMFTEIQKALKDARNSYNNELSKNSKVGFSFSK